VFVFLLIDDFFFRLIGTLKQLKAAVKTDRLIVHIDLGMASIK
jgi:hypothetical protein